MAHAHWTVIDRRTGEFQHVMTPRGGVPADHGYPVADFRAVKLARQPGEHDDFDGKRLVHSRERAAQTEKRKQLAALGRDDLIGLIEHLIDERLAAHGIISGAGK